MADIFISYASEDRSKVEPLAKVLKEQGWSVWWDRDLPSGRPFDEMIRTELRDAGCVVALWTENAANSLYVRGEAREALSLKKLISVFFSPSLGELPYDLQAIHGVKLIDWDGDTSNVDYQRLVHGITTIVGRPPQKKAKAKIEHKVEEEAKKKADVEVNWHEKDRNRKEAEGKNAISEVAEPTLKTDIGSDSTAPLRPKPTEPIAPKHRKTRNTQKFGAVTGVIVLLIVGILIIYKVFQPYPPTSICRWPPFIPFVPDVSKIALDQKWNVNCHSGEDCIKIGFGTKSKSNWGGLYWHANGNESGPGVNLYEFLNVEPDVPIILSFYARGAEGGEVVKFQVGGANNEKESVEFRAETSITLTSDWESYEIDLEDKDLSHVVRGFSCIITEDNNPGKDEVWFFLDDLCYRIADK